jgi:diguanylate cyclase
LATRTGRGGSWQTCSTPERLDAALRSLEELATTDHVTGVYNRRAAEERLAEDIARAQREGGALTLAALDLDDFKPINDEHGHRAGDACIKQFADFLGRNLRQGDWVGRWGGDEFVVGLWHAGEEAQPVERVLARVAEEVRENPVVLPNGKEAYLTFSGGVGRWKPGEDAQSLFSKADEALYRAKEGGGNSVVRAD